MREVIEVADGVLVATSRRDLTTTTLVLHGTGARVPFPEPVELVEHDGHAPGHCAVWLPERRVLLAGDMLSDVELPLPLWPDDLPAYLVGLERLAPYVERAGVLVPGHGHPGRDAPARLAADRRYLEDLRVTGDSADPRRDNPGMAEVHEQVLALTRRTYEA